MRTYPAETGVGRSMPSVDSFRRPPRILLLGYLSRLGEPEPDSRVRHPLNIILDGLRKRQQPTCSDR